MFRAQAPGFVPLLFLSHLSMRRAALAVRATGGAAPLAFGLIVFSADLAHAAGGALEIFPDKRIFIQIALFALLIAPMNKFLFQPVMRVLEERREQIEGARARAETMQAEADSVLKSYEASLTGAREKVENERKVRVESARDERTRLTATARAGAEERIMSARSEVATALEQARAQMKRETDELAREAASRVLGRELS
jgi:F-type H+-transporting ATPase subunit b